MTTFPSSPSLLKSGLALLDPQTGTMLRIIPLQYNPNTLMRTPQMPSLTAEDNHSVTLRLERLPVK